MDIIKFNYNAKEKLIGSILNIIVAEIDRKREKGKSLIDLDTQISIIRRINLGAVLKDIANEYGLDPSVLSRVKSEKAWMYAYDKLKLINAQRLSKTS